MFLPQQNIPFTVSVSVWDMPACIPLPAVFLPCECVSIGNVSLRPLPNLCPLRQGHVTDLLAYTINNAQVQLCAGASAALALAQPLAQAVTMAPTTRPPAPPQVAV